MIQERLDKIMLMINTIGIVNASEAADKLGVSMETIRRDLELLEGRGKLKRVYGGAISNTSKGTERDYNVREVLNLVEKRSIAIRTAELISDGDTIVLDIGTTTLEVAKHLSEKKELTCLTNSLVIGMELAKNQTSRVFMLGGQLRSGDFSTSGFMTESGLQNFRVDKAIIGASGITVKNGVTDYNVEEANVRRKMISIAEQVILTADSSKFGVSTFVQVCQLEQIQIIVTDWKVSQDTLSLFKTLKSKIYVAAELK